VPDKRIHGSAQNCIQRSYGSLFLPTSLHEGEHTDEEPKYYKESHYDAPGNSNLHLHVGHNAYYLSLLLG